MRALSLFALVALALVALLAPTATMVDAQLDCSLHELKLYNGAPSALAFTSPNPNFTTSTYTTLGLTDAYTWTNPVLKLTAYTNSLLQRLSLVVPGASPYPQVQLMNEAKTKLYGFQSNSYNISFSLTNADLPTQCGQSQTYSILSNETLGSTGRANECNYTYYWTITTPACIQGDPMFAGLRGQHFQVHGIDGMIYSLISAPQYAVNSRFDFLSGPRPCPIMPSTGAKASACWTHPGSYVGAVGVTTTSGDSLVVESGPANSGFSKVLFNGRPVQPNDASSSAASATSSSASANAAHVDFTFNTTHELTVEVGDFTIVLENVDSFVNLRSVFVSRTGHARLATDNVHGLLGQTWRLRRYSGAVSEIEGDVDQYVIESNELLDTRFAFSRFVESADVEGAAAAQ